MSRERKRSIKTAQLGMRELNILLVGATGTLSVAGFDEHQVSVTDLGVGNYKVTFLRPFERACALGGFASVTTDRTLEVVAVAVDSITILCNDLAGAPAEADVYLCIKGSDARYNV